MKKTVRKNVELGVLFGLICAIVLNFLHFEARCDELRQGVLRLHIIANSDDEADQKLKLEVRDEILKNSTDMFKNCNSTEDAIITASESIESINKIANKVIKEKGFSYGAIAEIRREYFPTRVYGEYTLEEGEYLSLILTLGKGEGQNWWCVVYPPLCFSSAIAGEITYKSKLAELFSKWAGNG